jgi:predicted small secreted protein
MNEDDRASDCRRELLGVRRSRDASAILLLVSCSITSSNTHEGALLDRENLTEACQVPIIKERSFGG